MSFEAAADEGAPARRLGRRLRRPEWRTPRVAAAAALLRLVAVRIARRPASSALVVAGVALAALAVGGSRLAATAARDVSLRDEIGAASHEARSIRVALFRASGAAGETPGMPPVLQPGQQAPVTDNGEYEQELDPRMVRALPREGFGRPVTRAVLTSAGALHAGGRAVRFVGLDEPAPWLRLTSGRAPARCTGDRCEAVLVGGRAPATSDLRVGRLRLRIVGRARLDPAPVGAIPPRDPTTVGARATFLLVNGSRRVIHDRALSLLPRAYFWSRELEPGAVHPWNLDAVRGATRRARAERLAAGAQAVAGPDRLLDSQRVRGRATAARLGLLVAEAAAALLAFAAFAATQRRRDLMEELDRVRDAGGTRVHLAAVVALEAGALAGLGVLLGCACAVTAGVVLGGARVMVHDVPTLGFVALMAACLLAAGGALALAARAPAPRERSVGRADLILAAALGVGLWQALSRGALSSADLAAGGGDPAVLLLPALVVAAAALLTLRALPAALRGLARLTRNADAALRMTVLGLARDAPRSGATVAMVAAAGAAGLFALSYSDTLQVGAADQAAFAVGSDVRVAEAPPARQADPDVLPAGRYSRVPGVAGAAPVIRRVADRLDANETPAGSVALLGVPASELPRLAGWRRDLAAQSPARLGRLLGPAAGLTLAGDVLPPRARTARMRVVVQGSELNASLAIQGRDGRVSRVPLVQEGMPRRRDAVLRLAPAQRGGRVIAVLVTTALGGADQGAAQASLGLGPLRAGGRVVTRFDRGWAPGPEASRFPVDGTTLSVPLTSVRQAFSLDHVQPAARQPLPAVLSGALGRGVRLGEIVPLRLADGQVVRLRAVARADELPTVASGRDGVLVDTGRLFATANLADPGALVPNEMWLRLKPGARIGAVHDALGRAPFRHTAANVRRDRTEELRSDPLAVATRDVLKAVGLIALALAGAALVLSVATGLRDERGELTELEALGLPPAALRRQVHAGALFLAVVGVLGAAGGGALLLRIVLRLVDLSGEGRAPLPSLLAAAPWTLLVGAGALALGGALALVVALSGRALRGDEVGRLGG